MHSDIPSYAALSSVDRKGKHTPRRGIYPCVEKLLALLAQKEPNLVNLKTSLESWGLMIWGFIYYKVSVWFWYQDNAGFMNELEHVPSYSVFGKALCETEFIP